MSRILGINAYHGDSAACLVVDGCLVAAAEEERFRRIKHWAGFPSRAISYVLQEGGLSPEDLDHVAINRDPKSNWGPRLSFVLAQRPSLAKIAARLKNRSKVRVEEELAALFPACSINAEVHHIQHHRAHLASTALVAPFNDCVAVSVDQFGDFASAAWGRCRAGRVEVEGSVFFPHSLGTFYSALTQYIGFPHYGDEYKLMGLAPYGKPTYLEQMRQIVHTHGDGRFSLNLRYFRHHTDKIYFEWRGRAPEVGELFSDDLMTLLGPRRRKGEPLEQRHRDLARSVQARYEEAFFNLLCALHREYSVDNVALAGGCAMNSVANGKIYANTPFERAYIQAAAGDAGGALGAALCVHADRSAQPRTSSSFVMSHALWGPSYEPAEIQSLLSERETELQQKECSVQRVEDADELCEHTARAVADGKVVGWFQGRMEWGPRALGNRSIVCDPRRADMKEILNQKIKRRESFRPFAPSILRSAVSEWFETDDDVPFMMKVFVVRADKREQVPAITHVDGTGRLQSVRAEVNPLYHRLISAFAELTGVPLVLNTSFNENEPVVCQPSEALDCFLRTRMDVLVLGDTLIERL